ncbi:MAG: hypothetical protein ACRC3J_05245 [Culicoidibacterales bacterium]
MQDYIDMAKNYYDIEKYAGTWMLRCKITNEVEYTMILKRLCLCVVPNSNAEPLFFENINEFSLWLDM